jgi:hypothetical protein
MCNLNILCKDCPDKDASKHVCGYRFCRTCKKYEHVNHKCFIQPLAMPKEYTEDYIWFDFEAEQTTGKHVVNLGVAQYFDESKPMKVIQTIQEFCLWAFDKQHEGYTFIAHNSAGYDGHFILNYCYKNSLKPFTIYNGSKIMYMSIEKYNIRFIDSLNFISAPLRLIPKMFGIENLVKKGYFAHKFNTPQNQNYVGPYPSIELYEPNKMSDIKDKKTGKSDRDMFINWYNSVKDTVFNFKEEFLDYCINDVVVLRAGCKILRQLFIDQTGIDCFQSVTIASACMKILRTNFLDEKTIGIVKNDNILKDNFSKKSIIALDWHEHQRNLYAQKTGSKSIKIQHALNGGEVTIAGYKVDGYCKETNTVVQFHGCFWHGCDKCKKHHPTDINKVNGKTFNQLAADTKRIENEIRKDRHDLIVIHECEFDNLMLTNRDFQEWFKTYDNTERVAALNPREGFFGGRTDAVRLHYEAKKAEQIKYIDFVSLYPYINKYGWYPIGHPTIFHDIVDTDISKYQGVVHCDVLPPQNLRFGVLPAKINNKLLFPLCGKCAQEQSSCACKHCVEERTIRGIWTHLELTEALHQGYVIQKIHEVHHFNQGQTGLFANYINLFLKVKAEASGYDDDCDTDEKKQAFIDEYFRREGIQLDPSKIEKNPGLRALAKLCLNSMWGKFGQRPNMTQTKIISDISEYYALENDKRVEILNWRIVCNDADGYPMVNVEYNYKDYECPDQDSTNVYIAIFTTSQARLKLYGLLHQLQDRVLYFDTDSVIYVWDENAPKIKEGNFLGEPKNELGSDDYITEFTTTGPKSYAYTTKKNEVCCKIKGFTLNYENSQVLNMNSLSKLVAKEGVLSDEEKQQYKTINESKITRTKDHQLVNKREEKYFSFECDKGCIDWKTKMVYPYGYIHE